MIFTRHDFMEMGKKVWIFLNFVANTLNVSIKVLGKVPTELNNYMDLLALLFIGTRLLHSTLIFYAVVRKFWIIKV